LDATVTVLQVTDKGIFISFADAEDVEYFKVGGRFVAFFTPISGDLAGEANTKPESGD